MWGTANDTFTSQVLSAPCAHTNTHLQPNPRVDQIGQEVQLSVRVVNNGPSTTARASLDIFIPTNDAGSNLYYLYLFDYSQSGSGQISCEGPFNPQDLPPPSDSRRRRRKR